MSYNNELLYQKLAVIDKKLDNIIGLISEQNLVDNETNDKTTETDSKTKKKINLSKTKKNIVKSGNLTLNIYNNGCTITGDTFDKKNLIKNYKGRWTPDIKGWTVKLHDDNINNLKNDLLKCTTNLKIVEKSEKLIFSDNESTIDLKKNNVNIEVDSFISDDD